MNARTSPHPAIGFSAAAPDGFGVRDGIQPFFNAGVPFWKRMVDIAGASVLLLLLSPMLAAIALLIKVVSPGPVIYRQERLGLGGRRFSFLKFRTMRAMGSDARHRQYLRQLITASERSSPPPMKKLDASNPNIIPMGRLLRSTCLDELPQLVNVLRGEMSLVGPRPPIPYEAAAYQPWHRTRFSCLPGMTGLWQISGKNRLSFREMIRLDIRYARSVSFWLDMRILLSTPLAIAREILWQRRETDRAAGEERRRR